MEFHRGQRVRCIDDENGYHNPPIQKGELYTIAHIYPSGLLSLDNQSRNITWFSKRFVPVDNPDTDYDESEYSDNDI